MKLFEYISSFTRNQTVSTQTQPTTNKSNCFQNARKMYQVSLVLLLAIGTALTFRPNVPNVPIPPTPPKSYTQWFVNGTGLKCNAVFNRNGLIDKQSRWRNFYMQPDPNFNNDELQLINAAMYQLSQVLPCVNFGFWHPHSYPSGDYVYIHKGVNSGCNAELGRRGGRQNMFLESPSCMNLGTVMHEMIHALGIHHEQCRSDRDNYIAVNYNNIQPNMKHNFDKVPDNYFSNFGVPYNQQSIMHYDNFAGAINHNQPTILARNGQRVGMDYQNPLKSTDVLKLRRMYEC